MSEADRKKSIDAWQRELRGADAEDVLRWAAATFPGGVQLASSLGLEDQVLTDMVARLKLAVPVFTIDTGRLFPQSLELVARTEQRYGLRLRVYFPAASEVEEMVISHGIDLFRNSVELRKLCCRVRKVEPLRRALSGLDAWICGLRRQQSVTREDLEIVEWDAANGLVKINPLAGWSEAQVRECARAQRVPHNPLHEAGYPSIGCASCTRAVAPGEDLRAGRWWWETPEKKECGLHWAGGKPVRGAATRGGGKI